MGTNQRVKTRLGDLLVERGSITQEQLQIAIEEQKSSHMQLGEILVSKGWISRRQIRRTLRAQSKLRNAILTSILSFSPMVLVGCGGGGGSGSQVGSDEVVAETTLATKQGKKSDSKADRPEKAKGGPKNQDTSTATTTETSDTYTDSTTSTSSSTTSSSSETSSVDETTSETSTTDTSSSETSTTPDAGSTVHLSWDYPLERINGSSLEVYEIDSFRVYQLNGEGEVGAMHIVDGLDTEYDISGLADGEYHFAVTVVDTDGMESDYSEVVKVSVL